MILQALYHLYQRLESGGAENLPTPGYSLQPITFRAVISSSGDLIEIHDARSKEVITDKKGKGKVMQRPTPMVVPGKARASEASIEPCWLWDDTRFVFGWHGARPDDPRNLRCFEAFKAAHLAKENEIDDHEFRAVCAFLRDWRPAEAAQNATLSEIKQGRAVFQVTGQKHYVHDSPGFKQWWEQQLVNAGGDPGQCLVTGTETNRLARLHPGIFGVPGSPYTGAALVSFNASAYESYGKEGREAGQCRNAAVSDEVADEYAAALNHLLADRTRKFRIGDSTTVFWTEKPTPAEVLLPCMLESANEPEDAATKQRLTEVMRRVSQGQLAADDLGDATTAFYILGLALNQGRLSVRFWHTATLGDLTANLQAHFDALRLARQWDETNSKYPDPITPSVYQLLRQTAREADSIPPLLAGALMRAILLRTRYPGALINNVMNRIRVVEKDQQGRSLDNVTYLRAAILKAWLVRNQKQEVQPMLDENNTDTGYRLGRLFAVLEKAQQEALPGINATIRERYYSAASATPRAVFGRLLRTYPHHLGKIENPGRKINLERMIQDILAAVKDFPAHLNLKSQAQFALGYYHQRKALFSGKPTADQPEAAVA